MSSSTQVAERPTRAQRRAAIARAAKSGDSEATEQARREYAADSIEEYVQRVIESAPPLTYEQRVRIAALLRPNHGGGRVV